MISIIVINTIRTEADLMAPIRSENSVHSKPRGKFPPGMANVMGGPPSQTQHTNLNLD